jgi:hypothetical protein
MQPILVYNDHRKMPLDNPDMETAIALASLALGLGLTLMALWWVLGR